MKNNVHSLYYSQRRINDVLMMLERTFLLPQGLPGRPEYRHALFSPAKFDSYGKHFFKFCYQGLLFHISLNDWCWSSLQLLFITFTQPCIICIQLLLFQVFFDRYLVYVLLLFYMFWHNSSISFYFTQFFLLFLAVFVI